ncbi:argC [Symbiodinium pilosum]|uniref:ArgC protein n=1 Tax=Symbiodinium pilosum TaxID=2952 RepID=A0A812TCK1_SYMPI|nr:argC [Symbiodinium pilosum]
MAIATSLKDEEDATFASVFPESSKLDAYSMALDDIGVFEEAGFQRDHIGMLATYGFVDFAGMRTLLQGIAERLRPDCTDLSQALAGMRFLDLGSGDGRAVIGAAVLAPTLVESAGVELSVSRHELADRNRRRLPDRIQEIVHFHQTDILQVDPVRLGATEIVWLANLRFPDETVEAINAYLEEHCAKEVDADPVQQHHPSPRSMRTDKPDNRAGRKQEMTDESLTSAGGPAGETGKQVQQENAGSDASRWQDGRPSSSTESVRERLEKHPEIQILSLDADKRKDEDARREALQTADAAVLCLPDDAARAAVALAEGSKTVIVDASTAHRVSDGWLYGFPEMSAEQAKAISTSTRIANPGCYPTGFIGLVRPLVDAGLLPSEAGLVVHAVSGYSGGGKGLIKTYEEEDHEPWGAYGFALNHKHLPEMAKWTGLEEEPIFCPAVGDFKQGMVVSVPLRYSQLRAGTTAADVHAAMAAHYEGKQFVSVKPLNDNDALERGAFLRPDAVNNTNKLELFCFANEDKKALWLAARLDNLGKGASGACVQNLNLALGFPEETGL